MKKLLLSTLSALLITTSLLAQAVIKGAVKDRLSKKALPHVKISIENSAHNTSSDEEGRFELSNVKFGPKHLLFEAHGYQILSKQIEVNSAKILLEDIVLEPDLEAEEINAILLTDNDLSGEDGIISPAALLQSSKDPYSQTAAFDWGAMWFRNRGYGSDQSQALFNGTPLEQLQNGRVNFSGWGGLNDITRYAEEVVVGAQPSDYSFGRVGENVYYNTRASAFGKSMRLAGSLSNRSYTQRLTATYASGLLPSQWAFAASGSRRWAEEGPIQGNFYDAWAYFLAMEKKFNARHSLNLTAFGTPWRRGMNAALSQEIVDIKDALYNPNWGWQNGRKRHARVKRAFEPIVMLTHYWDISPKIKLTSTLSYQFGQSGYSRLERGFVGKRANGNFIPINDPMPTYYKNLPSYAKTPAEAARTREKFLNDDAYSQINWPALYAQNLGNPHTIDNYNGTGRSVSGNAAKYYLSEDQSKSRAFAFNTHLFSQLSDHIGLKAALRYQWAFLEQFKTVKDLLGAYFVYDVDNFAAAGQSGDPNLRMPNHVAFKGDRVQYDYNLFKQSVDAHALVDFSYALFDFYLNARVAYTNFWREGKSQHYSFPKNSYGKSEKQDFLNYGLKTGLTLKLDGQNALRLNSLYANWTPTLENAFPNARVSNLLTPGLKSLQVFNGELSYLYNSPSVEARATLYYTKFSNEILINRYYSENYDFGFINEATTGIEKQHTGAEIGLKTKLSSTWKLLGAAAIGQFIYTNNPTVYYSHNQTPNFIEKGRAYIKNYRVSGSPQQAYRLGVKYESPHYWWMGLSGNYLAANYVNIIPGLRTKAFYEGANNPTEAQARRLLRQERFSDEFFLNLSLGKSWKLGEKILVASLNVINLLDNTHYKTGGYEQGRKSTYESLLQDQSRPTPQFRPRYWRSQGMLFFLNLSARF